MRASACDNTTSTERSAARRNGREFQQNSWRGIPGGDGHEEEKNDERTAGDGDSDGDSDDDRCIREIEDAWAGVSMCSEGGAEEGEEKSEESGQVVVGGGGGGGRALEAIGGIAFTG